MNILEKFKTIKKKLLIIENIYFLIFILLIFFSDRFTKFKIINNFSENRYFINDFLNFELIWNPGVGFGLLSINNHFIYNAITGFIGIIIVLLVYFFLNSKSSEKAIYSMIIGGALGNFYDRIIYKAVPDFIDLHYNNFHWFTFNFADIFITIGVILYISNDLIIKKNE